VFKHFKQLTLLQPDRTLNTLVVVYVVGWRRVNRVEKWPNERLIRVTGQLTENAVPLLEFVT